MKNLRNRIYEAINNTNHDNTQYTDNYDGFTHSTYSGLVDEVIEELDNEGYDLNNVTNNDIKNMVFDLIN